MNLSNNEMVLLMLSCDAYSDLWEEFFYIRDKYWPDCEYKWYLVTETKNFVWKDVNVIKCGNGMNWAARLRYAVQTLEAGYFGLFLDDYYLSKRIDSARIKEIHNIVIENAVDYINMSDVFFNIVNHKNNVYFKEHLIVIPKKKKYGISTESAIWKKEYLLNKLGEGDYSAWQFEIDRCKEAESNEGFDGFLLCDDQLSFNVSIEPVVIQGKFNPKAVKAFKKKGVLINKSGRQEMSLKQCFIFGLKMKMARVNFLRSICKWFAEKILGIKFFT